jgi:hypothetical protein
VVKSLRVIPNQYVSKLDARFPLNSRFIKIDGSAIDSEKEISIRIL